MWKDRKNRIRLILFLFVAALAVFSFTYGVRQLGEKQPGFYPVDPTDQVMPLAYQSGISLTWKAEGSSRQIRETLERVQVCYSAALSRGQKLLDARIEDEALQGIYALNHHPGETLEIDPELAEVLREALALTEENAGWSLFAGVLWREWQALLYANAPEDFDPLRNAETASRLHRLAEALQGPDAPRLELTWPEEESPTACLIIPEGYLRLCEELEMEDPAPLELGILREAILIDRIAEALLAQGFQEGFLMGSLGAVRVLGAGLPLETTLDHADGTAAPLSLPAPGAAMVFSARSGEVGQGSYTLDGTPRHAWFDARTGDISCRLYGALLTSETEGCTALARQMVRLTCAENPDSLPIPETMQAQLAK